MMYRAAFCLIVLASMFICASNAMAADKQYLTYENYKKLIALCSEVKGAKLDGLLPAAEDLWSKGQLKMPEETHVYRGDFDHDGSNDCAIGITGDGCTHYVLIAKESPAGVFKRAGLVKTKGEIKGWNGRALGISPNGFIAWTGDRFQFQSGALAEYVHSYDTSDFGGTMFKLTYVGPQNEPYPGLLISTFHKLPSLNEFKSHRKQGLHYGNDDMKVLWHMTVSPAKLKAFIETLSKSEFLTRAEDRAMKLDGLAGISHSLSILDTSSAHRPNYYEVFLQRKEVVALLKSMAQSTKDDNRQVLLDYAKMFGG